jgi:acetyl esterase/lipase
MKPPAMLSPALKSFCLKVLGSSLLSCSQATSTYAQKVVKDIEYATTESGALKLDLYLPTAKEPPVIVYIHGGAWRSGSKADMPLQELQKKGYAIASVDYRLSTVAPFPAQVHDIKAAVRFLRAEAGQLQISAKRIGLAGSSAGGHLAALVGVTNGHAQLEGKLGGHLNESSDVQAIISLYGASNLQTILSQSTEFGLKMRVPALQLLLGSSPQENPDLARLASPVAHLDAKDPPLLLMHGDADQQMPFAQAEEFAKAYTAAKLSVEFVPIAKATHGAKEFYDSQRMALMLNFLDQHLRSPAEAVPRKPVP